jgi:two-component system, OmpR family, response regulator
VSILLIQHDTKDVALQALLEHGGFLVAIASHGDEQMPIESAAVNVVALGTDLALDDRIHLCKRLRAQGYGGAIVILGANAGDFSQLLDVGADDFVLAPIQASELIARVQIAPRRLVAPARWGPLEFDRRHRTASLRGRALALTRREYGLLSCLLEAGGEVVSRADLLSKVWASEEDPGSNLVQVHLSRLRDKLGVDANLIETVRRAGYRLRRGSGRSSHP